MSKPLLCTTHSHRYIQTRFKNGLFVEGWGRWLDPHIQTHIYVFYSLLTIPLICLGVFRWLWVLLQLIVGSMCSIAVLTLESVFKKLETFLPSLRVSLSHACQCLPFTEVLQLGCLGVGPGGAAAQLLRTGYLWRRVQGDRTWPSQGINTWKNIRFCSYPQLDYIREESLISRVQKVDFCSFISQPAADSNLCCLYCNIACILFHPCTGRKMAKEEREPESLGSA